MRDDTSAMESAVEIPWMQFAALGAGPAAPTCGCASCTCPDHPPAVLHSKFGGNDGQLNAGFRAGPRASGWWRSGL